MRARGHRVHPHSGSGRRAPSLPIDVAKRFKAISCLLAALVLASLCVSVSVGSASAADLRPRVEHRANAARVILAFEHEKPFDLFQLTNPERVVLDLPLIKGEPAQVIPIRPAGLVEQIRHGRFAANTSRIVVDCIVPVRVVKTYFTEASGANGARANDVELVIELAAASGAAAESTPAAAGREGSAGNFTEQIKAALDRPAPRATRQADHDTSAQGRHAPFVAPRPRAPLLAAGGLATTRLGPPTPRPRTPVIVLDPGHGGKDPGAISRSGIREKDVTLAVSRAVRRQLADMGRYKILLTRDGDVYLRLRERMAMARAAGADVFVSIHADSMRRRSVRGASVYTLSEKASDAETAALAERENKADLIGGVDLRGESPEVTNILLDLARRDTMNRSIVLASRLVPELGRVTPLLANPHRHAGFVVLKSADIPSVLVELGFLSNPQDEKLLRSREHQIVRARAIARAIHGYVSETMQASAL